MTDIAKHRKVATEALRKLIRADLGFYQVCSRLLRGRVEYYLSHLLIFDIIGTHFDVQIREE
jgi:hypothetical protein